jgi:hypothetical protein
LLDLQLIAAIVFVSGAPNWQYKIRMNVSEVPDPKQAVDDLSVSANVSPQNMYMWYDHVDSCVDAHVHTRVVWLDSGCYGTR